MTMLAQFAAAAGGVLPAYIEDVFSTYLYTGNGATQTITNGIDLAGSGGMIWFKPRSTATSHVVFDTVRGPTKFVVPNSSSFGEITNTVGNDLTSFNANGFSLGPAQTSSVNVSGTTQVAWTFRKQPKFFDIVTYTGNGSDPRNIAHNLGSVPGCMIIKCTSDGATDWFVYHRSLGNSQSLNLNQTGAAETGTQIWGTTTPTSTVFTVGNINANTNGRTYVAYLFAHDAGGFGLSGNENVVSCGSYTTDASGNATVNLGYEPQWVLTKRTDSATGGAWTLNDNMRGFNLTQYAQLFANTSGAESAGTGENLYPTATGFVGTLNYGYSNATYIYIAIRRGSMKVPTLGTTVFTPVTYTGDGSTTSGQLVTAGFPVDMGINRYKTGGAGDWDIVDRLRGLSSIGTSPNSRYLNPHNTNAEAGGGYIFDATNTSVDMYGFASPNVQLNYLFRRAPSFFDEVCWTGTGSGPSINHNLTVVPELIISKRRDAAQYWAVWQPSSTYVGQLNLTDAFFDNGPSPATTTQFKPITNTSGATFVAYLFATAPGVSKVGTYTGTGTTQAINCGFTAGARFVLIKRTDSTGDWYVWDSARGIVAGNDPYLLLNSTAAEVTSTDYVDTSAAGFELSSTAPAAINASGGTFIFLAIS